jgi:hypothetical protein
MQTHEMAEAALGGEQDFAPGFGCRSHFTLLFRKVFVRKRGRGRASK